MRLYISYSTTIVDCIHTPTAPRGDCRADRADRANSPSVIFVLLLLMTGGTAYYIVRALTVAPG